MKFSEVKVQGLVCLYIIGAIRSCPTADIEVILGVSPLHLEIARLAAFVTVRLKIKNLGQRTLHAVMEALPMTASQIEPLRYGISRESLPSS